MLELCRSARVLALVLLGLSTPAQAQLTEVQPGARVRLEAPGIFAGRYVGTVLTRDGGAIRMSGQNTAPLDIPLDRITSMEISRGKSRAAGAGRGIVWGVPIGLVMGSLLASSLRMCNPTCRDATSGEKSEFVAAGVVGGAMWGAGIGAIVGRERWERFVIAPRTGMETRSRRVQVGLSLVH